MASEGKILSLEEEKRQTIQEEKDRKKEYQQKYRLEHREKSREYSRDYYHNNKEFAKKRHHEYYKKHKKERRAHSRKYYYEHREERKEYQRTHPRKNTAKHRKYQREYRLAHKKEFKEYRRKWRKKNKEKLKEYNIRYNKEHQKERGAYGRKYQQEHKEERREYHKRYRLEHRKKFWEYRNKKNKLEKKVDTLVEKIWEISKPQKNLESVTLKHDESIVQPAQKKIQAEESKSPATNLQPAEKKKYIIEGNRVKGETALPKYINKHLLKRTILLADGYGLITCPQLANLGFYANDIQREPEHNDLLGNVVEVSTRIHTQTEIVNGYLIENVEKFLEHFEQHDAPHLSGNHPAVEGIPVLKAILKHAKKAERKIKRYDFLE